MEHLYRREKHVSNNLGVILEKSLKNMSQAKQHNGKKCTIFLRNGEKGDKFSETQLNMIFKTIE